MNEVPVVREKRTEAASLKPYVSVQRPAEGLSAAVSGHHRALRRLLEAASGWGIGRPGCVGAGTDNDGLGPSLQARGLDLFDSPEVNALIP